MKEAPRPQIEDVKQKRKHHIYILLILGIVITNFPIVWIIATGFKPSPEIINPKPVWVFRPILDHYHSLLTTTGDFDFIKYLINSLIITIMTTFFAIVIAYPAAYSLARYRTGGDNYSFWVLSIRMLPPVIFLIPISVLFSIYKLTDTRTGIIIAYLSFNIPFATWIIKSFIEDIPTELEKAAYMDGYSQFQVMTKIIMPLTRSAVVAVSIICFIFSWNEFLYALVISFLNATTLTVGAARFVTGYGIQWGRIGAATTVAIIPTLIVGFLGQKYLVRGLTMGAVK
jgi:multiple sugar transport system permease protein